VKEGEEREGMDIQFILTETLLLCVDGDGVTMVELPVVTSKLFYSCQIEKIHSILLSKHLSLGMRSY